MKWMGLAWRSLASQLQILLNGPGQLWRLLRTQPRWSLLATCLLVAEMLYSLINSWHYFQNGKISGSNSYTFPEGKAPFNICAYLVKDHLQSWSIASMVFNILYKNVRISFSPDRVGVFALKVHTVGAFLWGKKTESILLGFHSCFWVR